MPTPLEFFLASEREVPDMVFLRQPIAGKWKTFTFSEAGSEARRIASGLARLGLRPGSKVAILSKNCAHWIISDLAIMLGGFISVPIYPTLSVAGISQILDHSEAAAVFIGKLDNYESQRPGIPTGIHRISYPDYGIADGHLWNDWLKREQPAASASTHPDDLATIMYSSGTTGTPKGVMLTHAALAFVAQAVKKHLGVTKPERFFSYLPLSHIAERAIMEMVALASSSRISFAGSVDSFKEDLQHEKPTLFGGVPRIYGKFREGILQKIPQGRLNLLLSLPLVSSLIKRTVRKKLGLSHARLVVSGAAPIPVEMIHWFSRLGIEICEMYGMTENTAFSHANFRKVRAGTVGEPWPEVEVRISEDGEILVRHPALMKGYYKDPETTRSVFTDDGFLRTGDQGWQDDEGFLTITGRLKDQFKTDKAKFIAPAPIEMKVLSNSDIEQACVVGSGLPQPIALVTLSAQGKAKSRDMIERSISATLSAVNAELENYERLAKAVIVDEAWTLENGFLTPSLKLKRDEIEKKFHDKYSFWYEQKTLVIRE